MTEQYAGPSLKADTLPKPSRRTDRLITQAAGAELLIYDEEIHKACCLNDLAAAVWSACDGTKTVGGLAASASGALQRPVSEDLLLFTLAELRRGGLLLPDPATGMLPASSRRELLRKMGIGAAMALPVVAAIMAPKAAQAYSGCFNCSNVQRTPQPSRSQQLFPPEERPPNKDASQGSLNSWQ